MQLLASVSADEASLAHQILRAVAAELNRRLPLAAPRIRLRLSRAVDEALVSSPEFASLVGGRLQAELGVPNPVAALRAVVDGVAQGMEVLAGPVAAAAGGLTGGVTVRVLRTDLAEVLSLPQGAFESEGGHRIDWLDWLLTRGDEILVAEYGFVPGNFPASRTGLGLMKRAGGWRVPPEFAGTPRDNWLTRALGGLEDFAGAVIVQEVQGVL